MTYSCEKSILRSWLNLKIFETLQLLGSSEHTPPVLANFVQNANMDQVFQLMKIASTILVLTCCENKCPLEFTEKMNISQIKKSYEKVAKNYKLLKIK